MSRKRKLKVDFGERMAWALYVEATDLEHYACRPNPYVTEAEHLEHVGLAMDVKNRALYALVKGYGLNLDTLSHKARERYDEMIEEEKKKRADHKALMAECDRIMKEQDARLAEAMAVLEGGSDV